MHNNLTASYQNDTEEDSLHLWKRFNEGDRDAYQKLYRQYLPALYNYGCKIIYSPSLVTDCMQDMFIDLWKYRQRLMTVKSVKHYLFRCLRNRLIKEIAEPKYQVCDMKHTYEEVASTMRINLRSVYTLAWKALATLRKDMELILAIKHMLDYGSKKQETALAFKQSIGTV